MGSSLLQQSLLHFVNNSIDVKIGTMTSLLANFEAESLSLIIQFDIYQSTSSKHIDRKIQHLCDFLVRDFQKVFPYDVKWRFSSTWEDFTLFIVIRDEIFHELKPLYDTISSLKDLALQRLQGDYSTEAIEIFQYLTNPVLSKENI